MIPAHSKSTLFPYTTLFRSFDNKCSLCEEDEFELDHFIPISTNEGGTTVGNIIPLCRRMNSSKGARNPFEWASTMLNEEELKRFDRVVKFLARKNNMRSEERRVGKDNKYR